MTKSHYKGAYYQNAESGIACKFVCLNDSSASLATLNMVRSSKRWTLSYVRVYFACGCLNLVKKHPHTHRLTQPIRFMCASECFRKPLSAMLLNQPELDYRTEVTLCCTITCSQYRQTAADEIRPWLCFCTITHLFANLAGKPCCIDNAYGVVFYIKCWVILNIEMILLIYSILFLNDKFFSLTGSNWMC